LPPTYHRGVSKSGPSLWMRLWGLAQARVTRRTSAIRQRPWLGFLPGIGNALSANDSYRDFSSGHPWRAAISALGAVPMPIESIPAHLMSAYKVGQRLNELNKAGHSLQDIILGNILTRAEQSAFDNATFGDPLTNAFLEQGTRGLPVPSRANGMRYGKASPLGTSRNFADNRSEPGVSFAYVDHPSISDYRWYNMGGSSGNPSFYSGYLLHGRSGSEGEPLMIGLSPSEPFQIPPDPNLK